MYLVTIVYTINVKRHTILSYYHIYYVATILHDHIQLQYTVYTYISHLDVVLEYKYRVTVSSCISYVCTTNFWKGYMYLHVPYLAKSKVTVFIAIIST